MIQVGATFPNGFKAATTEQKDVKTSRWAIGEGWGQRMLRRLACDGLVKEVTEKSSHSQSSISDLTHPED
jgi:hypothetical protein